MTIVLKEIQAVDQTITIGPPLFKPRAIFAFGHDSTTHGKTSGAGVSGSSDWGFQTETEGLFGGVGFGITSPGSLETGNSLFSPPPGPFYGQGGGSTPTGLLSLGDFFCGELEINASLDTNTYVGAFILGGRTLETASGYGQFSGTGAHSVTGVGFQPDLVLMGGSGHTFLGSGGVTPGPYSHSFGACDGSLNQFACAVGSQYLGGTTASRTSRTVNNACFLQVQPGIMQANLTSMDADGFTLNVSAYTGAEYFWWVAIRDPGGNFAVGTLTEGAASITPGFEPEALFFASCGNTVYGTSQAGCGMAYGGADSSGTDCAGWAAGPAANSFSAHYWQNKALTWIIHPTGGSVNSEAEAEIASWGSTTSLTWTTGPGANGIKGGYVAMRTSPGPGYDGCGGSPQQIYRWLHR